MRLSRQERQEQINLANRLATVETNLSDRAVSSTSTHPPLTLPQGLNAPFKMEIPRLNGSDPLGWIFKINHFFNFHNIEEEQHISIASFYLDGPALNWYQ